MFTVFALIGLVVVLGFIALMTEVENFGWATLTLIAAVLGVHFLHLLDIVTFVKGHALETGIGVGAYLVVGIVWSFIKWFSYLHNFKDKFLDAKREFLVEHNLPSDTSLTEEFLEDFEDKSEKKYAEEYAEYQANTSRDHFSKFTSPSRKHIYFDKSLLQRPLAVHNKNKIVAWMSLWPFSMVGTLINDPVRRMFTFLFNQLRATYQRISDHVFRGTELK